MAPSDRQGSVIAPPRIEVPSIYESDAPAPATSVPAEAPSATSESPVEREAFVHSPAPRRTQPPVNVSAEDLKGVDYAESTSYTTRSHAPLSGAGYRRSRHQANRLKRDLRYGQYLEVPKGQRDIFSSPSNRRSTAVALLIALGIIIAVALLAVLLWPR